MSVIENKLRILNDDPRSITLLSALGEDSDLHIVGGAVRDLLIGRNITDIDYASSKDPDSIISLLEREGIKVIPTGLSHQTVTAKPHSNLPHVEITSFRSHGMNPEGGLCLGKSIEEDLMFRDFTINSLALKITSSESYSPVLIDPYGGKNDIQNKIIRGTVDPGARFEEDPLRILRMIRFSTQLGFEIEPDTLRKGISLADTLYNSSIERIREEFLKILVSPFLRPGFRILEKINFFENLMPEINRCQGFEQNKFHRHDVYEHTIDVLEMVPSTPLLRMATLLHDVGKPPSLSIDNNGERHFYLHEKIGADMVNEILSRFKFSNEFINAVELLVRTHMRPIDAGDGGLRRILRDTSPYYNEWRELKYFDTLSVTEDKTRLDKEFRIFDERIEGILSSAEEKPFAKLNITGSDLIELGFKPGPLFKDILNFLSDAVIENPDINEKNRLIELLKSKFYREN
ncbi:MAG TPA: HD domain-containing protein [Oligoflexia bacterium]|nr:HD domain-containing protein [Oligoflexia bacterium]HMP47989.1 HD domain-containing protein [Oligoflexia bacterium]